MYKLKNKRESFVKIALVFASIIIALVLIEVILQFTPIGEPKKTRVLVEKSSNEKISYELKKNFIRHFNNPDKTRIKYQTNSSGFRGEEITKDSSFNNILFLGDSITFGFGVEQEKAYPFLLEDHLNKFLQKRVQVINTAVGGYNTIQQLETYKTVQNIYKPKVVILGYSLNDASQDGNWAWDDQLGHISNKTLSISGGYKGPLGGRFPFGKIIDKSRIYNVTLRPILFREAESNSFQISDKEEYNLYNDIYISNNQKSQWDLIKQTLLELKSLTDKNKQDFLVLIFPLAYQVEFNTELNPQEQIVEFLKDNEIEYIDLLSLLKSNYDGDISRFYIDNSHPNWRSHEIIAQSLSKYLILNKSYESLE